MISQTCTICICGSFSSETGEDLIGPISCWNTPIFATTRCSPLYVMTIDWPSIVLLYPAPYLVWTAGFDVHVAHAAREQIDYAFFLRRWRFLLTPLSLLQTTTQHIFMLQYPPFVVFRQRFFFQFCNAINRWSRFLGELE